MESERARKTEESAEVDSTDVSSDNSPSILYEEIKRTPPTYKNGVNQGSTKEFFLANTQRLWIQLRSKGLHLVLSEFSRENKIGLHSRLKSRRILSKFCLRHE